MFIIGADTTQFLFDLKVIRVCGRYTAESLRTLIMLKEVSFASLTSF